MSQKVNRWSKSILISFSIFILFSVYLFLRRGYYNLYIANKVLGSTAVVLAGITLLIRPLSEKVKNIATYSRTSFMTIRRTLGLTAFGFACVHMVVSILFLPNKFPLSWYQNKIVPIIFGILALILWLYLAYISSDEKIRKLGIDIWKKQQGLFGKLAFLAIFLHLTIMKYEGWIKWLNGQVKPSPELANPFYPPASLFVFFLMLGVILYRTTNFFLKKNK